MTEQILDTILDHLRNDDRVRAIWLGGSRGRGTEDEFSDIDIWLAIDDVIDHNPLDFVHGIVPTIMHVIAPEIAPPSGAFIGSWVPVGDVFTQVDWYMTPFSAAVRAADTKLVYGDIPTEKPEQVLPLSHETIIEKVRENLVLALQMINNMVKHARRGHTWRAADHARYVDRCLANATWQLDHAAEPGFVAAHTTFLPEPLRSEVSAVQDTARSLLDDVERIATRAALIDTLLFPIAAMREVISTWADSGILPEDEFYRSLPRRRIGAGVLITDAAGRVLLLETTYKTVHEIPGGACEAGESPRGCAIREVREEIGLTLEIGRPLIFDHRSEPDPKGDAIQLVYDAGVLPDPSAIQLDGVEIAAYRFVDPVDLDAFVTPGMATRLRTAIRARQENRLIEIDSGVVVD